MVRLRPVSTRSTATKTRPNDNMNMAHELMTMLPRSATMNAIRSDIGVISSCAHATGEAQIGPYNHYQTMKRLICDA